MTVAPTDTLVVAGVITMLASVALVTVSVALPESPLYVAVIVVVPAFSAVAWPRVVPASETCATVVVEEVQLASVVTSLVVPSL
jgi:hypothetical protein